MSISSNVYKLEPRNNFCTIGFHGFFIIMTHGSNNSYVYFFIRYFKGLLPGLSLPTDDKNIHKSKSDSPFVCLLVPFKLRSYLRCERENLKEIWYEIIVTVMQQLALA